MPLAATVMTVLRLAAGAEPSEADSAATAPAIAPEAEASREVEPPADPAIEALQRAQQQIADQRVPEALESLEQALAADDTLAAAYLTRAQLLIDHLGDPDQRQREEPRWDADTIAQARLAASDLARYLEQVEISEDDAAPLELQRVRLLLQADKAEARLTQPPDPDPPAVVAPRPAPGPRPPRRWIADPLGGALTAGGLGVVGGGVATLVVGRRRHGSAGEGSEREFMADTRSGRTLNGVGIGLAALGGSLVVGGIVRYVLVSRRARAGATAILRRPHRSWARR